METHSYSRRPRPGINGRTLDDQTIKDWLAYIDQELMEAKAERAELAKMQRETHLILKHLDARVSKFDRIMERVQWAGAGLGCALFLQQYGVTLPWG